MAPSAHAAVAPLITGCNGEVCITISSKHADGTWTVTAFTPTGGEYTGHFELLTPNALHNQPTNTSGPEEWNVKVVTAGKYCVIGWEHIEGPNYLKKGEPCENTP
jgi:hypothetical protein